ncbi:MAG: type II toxin-antitoxin system RelE/ParE family toxin [Candidatus Omnitrophica bacterium]|nr:type II toxin-antitoxin system RelE/ParE family toxin [Candidatus Omnitrophota bacterium]
MRYLLNKSFSKKLKKELKNEKINKKEYIQELFDSFHKYKKDNLGAKLYKIRIARSGEGKSGGYRNIIFWEQRKAVIAVYIFAKGDKDNISNEELKYLKILAQQYETLTEKLINKAVKEKILEEIHYEEKER